MKNRDQGKYFVELDGVIYVYSGDRIEQVASLTDVDGEAWFVSDFQEALFRSMTIQAPLKYAEIMVRKYMQESGEFDEPVSVINHWKKKRDKTTTDILFTAIPTRLYDAYFQKIKECQDSLLLFPLLSVLYGVLKRMKENRPAAIIFQHNRFVDLLIGTRQRVLYANRCVVFDTSEEQIAGLWDTVREELETVEKQNRIKIAKVMFLTWLDSAPQPDWAGDTGWVVFSMEEETVSYDGQSHQVSFLNALRMGRARESISPSWDKALYYSKRWVPYINALFFLLFLTCIGGYLWYSQRGAQLERHLGLVREQMSDMGYQEAVDDISYEKVLSFTRQLNHYRRVPSYKRVINDISESLSEGAYVKVLKLDYSEQEVEIELFGKANTPFREAHRNYQRFIDYLSAKGYSLVGSKFDTQVEQSEFVTRFKKVVQH